ncbi:MAG: PBP1A family penicillin-binding protein [Aquisalinus sp.]|nr:PBP1A family penicillin-binding protein [Aquisalinus sp.]
MLLFTGGFLYHASFVAFLGFVAALAALFHFSRDLPSVSALEDRQAQHQVTLLDIDGNVITHYGNIHSEGVIISDLPPHVVQAFVATEDRNFYHHLGINPLAIGRALIVNLRSGDIRQGGSTITQQFAKNAFLTPEKTLKRKIQEMLLAFRLETAYSKDEILALYLNNVYFGAGAYGLRAASHRYFDKTPEALSVGESAMLAGLLKAPSRYSPSASPEAARDRARVVIRAMHDAGYLSRETMEVLVRGSVARLNMQNNPVPYATDYVMAELQNVFGPAGQDIFVHTTLDVAAHRKMTTYIEQISQTDKRFTEDIQVAAIAMERTGAVRLLIGGRDYEASQYNRALNAKRQPGSAFKPFVYLTALEAGMQPDDVVLDTPVQIGNWQPTNYKDRYYGSIEMWEAMARSLNAAVLHVQEETGRERVIATARRLGFRGKLDTGAALALGVNETTPFDLTRVYLPFANDGRDAQPFSITSVYNKSGKLLYAREIAPSRQLIDPEAHTAITHMLRQVVSRGSGGAATIPGYIAAGKTGTTQDSRDAWFVGYAAGLVGTVWLGKDEYTPMGSGTNAVSGSNIPAQIWREMMSASLRDRTDTPYREWQPPVRRPGIMRWLEQIMWNDPEPAPMMASDMATPVIEAIGSSKTELPVEPKLVLEKSPQSMDDLLADVMQTDEQTEKPEI